MTGEKALRAFRLHPGDDLRKGLEEFVAQHAIEAGAIVTCVGSLSSATLRMADENVTQTLDGPFEIVSLAGTLSVHGSHCHIALSDRNGAVVGGHLAFGCTIYTTAEIVIAAPGNTVFRRIEDPETGFWELVVEAKSAD